MSHSNAPICLDDFEKYAKINLPKSIYGFYASGADAEETLAENKAAFSRLRILPKILRDVSTVDIKTTILGEEIESPICVAPTAFHGLANEGGECATARACAAMKTCYCIATNSNKSLEDVAKEVSKDALRWFQLYVESDREGTKRIVKRAEKAGCKALVITVDRPRVGRRLENLRNAFKLPRHLTLGNFSDPNPSESHASNISYSGRPVDASLSWKDIAWFKSITKLPIVLKGVFRAEDAKMAVEHGVSAIIVSNHGGRQLDGCPAALEILPQIIEAVNGKIEVYVDGGVRKGTDVFKALALGARAVFLGRPIVYALAYNGEAGVKLALQIINLELRLAMTLAGTVNISEITADFVIPAEDLSFFRTLKRIKARI